jgi:hypothetical protein
VASGGSVVEHAVEGVDGFLAQFAGPSGSQIGSGDRHERGRHIVGR